MSVCGPLHKELNDQGYGKCSIPMWQGGMPAGFCDHIAFGFRTKEGKRRYDGYVMYLACYGHGGPQYNQSIPKDAPHHFGDPCIYCGIPYDDVAVGPCPARIETNK